MGRLVVPRTYWVGYTEMQDDEVLRYLEDSGNKDFWQSVLEAREAKISNAEILCSLFAKLCYKSLTLGQNENISRVRDIQGNIRGCFDLGHGCYDSETEVLTSTGWKNWIEVREQDYLATLTREGKVEYQKPVRLIHYQHRGSMYEVRNTAVDLLVTPDHKMLACRMTTKAGRKKEQFELIEAQKLVGVSHAYTKMGEWDKGESKLLPEVAALLGFIIGDMGYEGGRSVRSSLRKEREIQYVKKYADQLGWKFVKNDKWTLYFDPVYRSLIENTYTEGRERQIPSGVLLENDKNTLEYLLEGLLNSDGSFSKTSVEYLTTSRRLAGQVQQLALHVGRAGNIRTVESRESSYGNKPLYRITILNRNLKPQINQSAGDEYVKLKEVKDWEGEVFCAEVPNNTLYVRRNGIPVWSGNSVFEHVGFNFITADCSRIFTHELVRHRVGTGFSQNSGRYIRLDTIDMVFDPILEPVRGHMEEIQAFLETKYHQMVQDSGLADETNQTRKKKLTSALRRIAPNGQTNEIGYTLNLRTLRHLIMVRTSRFAEWEIRYVFQDIYNLLKDKYPLIFHGAKEEIHDGLVEVSGMKMQPYERYDKELLRDMSTDQLEQEIENRRLSV